MRHVTFEVSFGIHSPKLFSSYDNVDTALISPRMPKVQCFRPGTSVRHSSKTKRDKKMTVNAMAIIGLFYTHDQQENCETYPVTD